MTADGGLTAHATAIILSHLRDTRQPERHAENLVRQLTWSGLLAGQAPTISAEVPVREGVANTLQCVLNWPVAERIAADLDEAGLLAVRA